MIKAQLFDCKWFSVAERQAVEQRFCAALVVHLGGEEEVLELLTAFGRICARYAPLSIPPDLSDADREIVDRWVSAAAESEVVAFKPWPNLNQDDGHYFEVMPVPEDPDRLK